MAALSSKQRKRNAVGDLKAVAAELGCATRPTPDLTRDEFLKFSGEVAQHCQTPEQRKKLDDARNLYFEGQEPPALPMLPALPNLPEGSAAPSGPQAAAADSSFRLCKKESKQERKQTRKKERKNTSKKERKTGRKKERKKEGASN